MAYSVVIFGANDWQEEVAVALERDGVVVIDQVLNSEQCEAHLAAIVKGLQNICPELKKVWTDAHMPAGPRTGLCQSLVNIQPVWAVRTESTVREVFTAAYSGLRQRPITEFVCSCDGMNVRPPQAPFVTESTPDWAHFDQTWDDPFKCIQGQVVLSTSTACFRASPGSHRVFKEMNAVTLDNLQGNVRRNWNMFKPAQYPALQAMVEKAGGRWQVPIRVQRGAMILWLSSTVHSAMLHLPTPVVPDPTTQFPQWRGVVYVCFRPCKEVDDAHRARLKYCLEHNRLTNHWGSTMFDSKVTRASERPASILRYLENPELVYEDYPDLKPVWTPELLALV